MRSEFDKTWSERHGANGEGEQAKSLHTIVDALLAGGFDEEKEYETRRKAQVDAAIQSCTYLQSIISYETCSFGISFLLLVYDAAAGTARR